MLAQYERGINKKSHNIYSVFYSKEGEMNQDTKILRSLAYQYRKASDHPRNAENAELYRAVNSLRQIRPVVLINEVPFHELDYDNKLTIQCEDPFLKTIENLMRRAIFQWEHFPADMIVPSWIPLKKTIINSGNGIEVKEQTLSLDNRNNIIAHEYEDQFKTDEDLEKLHTPTIRYDSKTTLKQLDQLMDIFGDIIPVKLVGVNSYIDTWDKISMYRGVENLLVDLIDRPEFTHKLVKKLADIEAATIQQYEDEGLFELNPLQIHCTPALADELPSKDYDGGKVMAKDVWGRGMAQIFNSVSKSMHEEFDIEYMINLFSKFGLTYYGCCEPLDKKLDIVKRLPNLRKISITPWADVDASAEQIGKDYVLSNKPTPTSVAVKNLDEEAVQKELSRIYSAVKRNGCNCDMVLKDISSAGYNLNNLVRWEQIAMRMAKEFA